MSGAGGALCWGGGGLFDGAPDINTRMHTLCALVQVYPSKHVLMRRALQRRIMYTYTVVGRITYTYSCA